LEKQFLNEGDLLICARNGSRRLVGKNAIISQLDEPAAFGAFMAVCRSSYNPWICLVLNTTYFDRYLDDSNSATINQVTQSMLLAFPVPFPPKNEQDRIINEVAQLESVVANINDNIDCLNTVIKQTKSKILNLAIHGKLVPQAPTDEPAYELLKRINPKAEITCDNPHYRNQPKGWSAVPMQMLCSLVDGKKQSGVERINLDVKFLRGEREAKVLSAGKYVAANTLLILVDGENSGEVFRTPVEGYQGSTFKQLAINDNMYTDYVLQVINLHRKTLRENKVGSAIPHLNKKLFKTIDVPIPPYEEQQRIVNAINEAFTTLDEIVANL
jgi:type I restriction enzyme S subunit